MYNIVLHDDKWFNVSQKRDTNGILVKISLTEMCTSKPFGHNLYCYTMFLSYELMRKEVLMQVMPVMIMRHHKIKVGHAYYTITALPVLLFTFFG